MRRLTRSPNTILGRPVSKMIAPTLAVAAEVKLVATPTSNGDSWMARLLEGYDVLKAGGTAKDAFIGTDGQNAASVFALQVEQNAGSAIVLAVESIALRAAGNFFGA